MEKVYKYYAFISYKHADEKWAKRLQRQLETYRLPVALRKQNFPTNLKPVFRDNTDLTPGKLEEKLRENLEESRYLIVICSRNLARESHYIDFEMQTFLDFGRGDRIIPFIVDGEANAKDPEDECFSVMIKQMPGELLAANARKDGMRTAAIKVVAAILGLDADDLIRRDRRRLLWQRLLGGIGAGMLVFLLSSMLTLTAQNYEKAAENAYFYSDTKSAVSNALASLRIPFQKHASGNAAVILRNEVIANELEQSNMQLHKDYEIIAQNKGVTFFAESADQSRVAITDWSRLYIYNKEDGSYLQEIGGMSILSEEEKEKFEDSFGVSYDTAFDEFVFGSLEKSEPINHVETIEESEGQESLYIWDTNGSPEVVFYIERSSAKWNYTQQEDLVAVYPAEGDPNIYIYAFDQNLCFLLECSDSYSGISEMQFSPKGRYLFVRYYTKTAKGFYGSGTLCVYDLESREIVFARSEDPERNSATPWWHISTDTLYLFPAYRIEKYSFTDRKPVLVDNVVYVNKNGDEVLEKNPYPESVLFSEDGTKAVSIHRTGGGLLYNFFHIGTGEKLWSVVFEGYYGDIDITPDMRYAIYCTDDHVFLYDIEAADMLLDVDCREETVCSVAISRDGTCAAYINEEAVITVFRKTGGTYEKQTIQGYHSDEEKIIVCINNEACYVNSDANIRAYDLDTGGMRLIAENVYQYPAVVFNDMTVFRSLRDVEALGAILCDIEFEWLPVFYSKDGGEIPVHTGLRLLNMAYATQTGLLVGIEHTNQMQYNGELIVIKTDPSGHEAEVLYRYRSKIEILSFCFDNTGKYIIINGRDGEGSEVLDAQTGELLFYLDRNIRIYGDVVYDISGDLVLPDALPHGEICSIDAFIKKGAALLG